MLDRLFPRHLNASYRGPRLAIWIFGALALMKLALGLGHIFNPDGGAQTISHIPLDSYPAGAAQNVVALFARMGIEQILLGLILLAVLLRARALIPLAFAVLVLGHAGGFALAAYKPLALSSPSDVRTMHWVLAGLSVVGFALSLRVRRV